MKLIVFTLVILVLFVFKLCLGVEEVCGMVKIKPNRRIKRVSKGSSCYYGEVPWMLALLVNNVRTCGAVLVSSRWAFTVAHCVDKSFMNPNMEYEYKLVAGDHLATDPDMYETFAYVVKVIIYPGYNHVTLENDIALLETDEPFVFNDYIRPVCLPKYDETPFPFEHCTAFGWGFINSKTKANELQKLELVSRPHKHCETKFYPRADRVSKFSYKMMCASLKEGGVCAGDSGGPLICPRFNNEHQQVVVGLTSWTTSKCEEGGENSFPVFTRIESYIEWIETIMTQKPTVNSNPCQKRGLIYYDRSSDEVRNPNYGKDDYLPNRRCSWKYNLEKFNVSKVIIRFKYFELENKINGICSQDYLKIYTGRYYDKLIGSFCGSELINDITIDLKTVAQINIKFDFITDFSINKSGFVVSFESS